jgi:hypothetical protein
VKILVQLRITDFTDKKEQLLDRESDLAAEKQSNGEFGLRGVSKNDKRRRTK